VHPDRGETDGNERLEEINKYMKWGKGKEISRSKGFNRWERNNKKWKQTNIQC
jgi:hypothetical protein